MSQLSAPNISTEQNPHLQRSFNSTPRANGNIESENGPCSAPSLLKPWPWAVVARWLVPVVVATPEPNGGHRRWGDSHQAEGRVLPSGPQPENGGVLIPGLALVLPQVEEELTPLSILGSCSRVTGERMGDRQTDCCCTCSDASAVPVRFGEHRA